MSERVGLGTADGRIGESIISGDMIGVFDPDGVRKEL
jgi:hypothetical protein